MKQFLISGVESEYSFTLIRVKRGYITLRNTDYLATFLVLLHIFLGVEFKNLVDFFVLLLLFWIFKLIASYDVTELSE